MEKYKEVERSIIKTYRKEIWHKFVKAVKEYQLINENDNIAVCMSGGKDSMLLAKCMQELQAHGDFYFGLKFIVMDPGYNEYNRKIIEENAKHLNVPIKIYNSNIFEVVSKVEESPCYLCARMRRGYLYKFAKEEGCNKIALGHHFDDVVETILMSMIYSGEFKTMMPKLKSKNFPGMELIRPLYLVKEKTILAWQRYNNLNFINCACRFVENCSLGDAATGSKRFEMKELIKRLRKSNPNADKNIFKSTHNVNLDTIIGYHNDKFSRTFLDDYEEKFDGKF